MTTSEHPSPEDLSASLDGEAPAVAAHVAGCARCQADVARLRAVSAAVAHPVAPPPPSVVDAAVAAALEGASGVRATQAGPGVRATQAGGDHAPVRGRRRSRAFVVAVAAGSVAAVLLAVLASFAVVDRDRDGTAVDTALAPGQGSAVQDRAAAGAGAPPPGALSGGDDLGEVGDPGALAARLGGRIPGTQGAPVPMAAAPAGEAEAAPPSAGSGVQAPCEPEARRAGHDLGPLVYVGGGTRGGRPVVVLGFGPATPGSEGVSLLVLARDGCELVYATSVS